MKNHSKEIVLLAGLLLLASTESASGKPSGWRYAETLMLPVPSQQPIQPLPQPKTITKKDSRPSVDDRFEGNNTWLHYAVRAGRLDMVYWLLEAGADINAVNDKSETAFPRPTKLHIAAAGGHLPLIIEYIQKEGWDVNACDHSGYTPLHIAAAYGQRDVAAFLVHAPYLSFKNYAKLEAVTIHGHTPADIALACGHNDIAVMISNEAARQRAPYQFFAPLTSHLDTKP